MKKPREFWIHELNPLDWDVSRAEPINKDYIHVIEKSADEEIQCVAGCQIYSYHEAHHHKDCGHYPETFSKMYDTLKAERDELKMLEREKFHKTLASMSYKQMKTEAIWNDSDNPTDMDYYYIRGEYSISDFEVPAIEALTDFEKFIEEKK